MRLAALLAALLLLLLGAASCGGDDGDDDAQPAPPAATGDTGDDDDGDTGDDDGEASGEAIFAANCGSCHTLQAAGTSGSIGPDLDQVQPDSDRVEAQVRQGGGGMPAFEGRLTDDEIEAVAEYVADSAGG